MNTANDRHAVEDALRDALARFAETVVSIAEGIASRVEFHRSHVYAIAGTLTFFEPSHPEVELVVATIHLRLGDEPDWEVDVMDRDSVVFAELDDLSVDDAERMTTDPVLAATTVETFLEQTRGSVLKRLGPIAH